MSDDVLNDSLPGNPHEPYGRTPLGNAVTINGNPNGRIWAYQHRTHDLMQFQVTLKNLSLTERDTIADFFYGKYSHGDSFLWKDPSRYTVARQSIGTGDGVETDYQLIETYDGRNWNRYNIIDGSQTVWVNSVQQTETTHYTLDDTDSGIVVFGTPPTDTHDVEASFQFRRRCMFFKESDFQDTEKTGNLANVKLRFFEIVPDVS